MAVTNDILSKFLDRDRLKQLWSFLEERSLPVPSKENAGKIVGVGSDGLYTFISLKDALDFTDEAKNVKEKEIEDGVLEYLEITLTKGTESSTATTPSWVRDTSYSEIIFPKSIALSGNTISSGFSYEPKLSTFGSDTKIICTFADGSTSTVPESYIYISPDTVSNGTTTTITFTVYYNSETGEFCESSDEKKVALKCTTSYKMVKPSSITLQNKTISSATSYSAELSTFGDGAYVELSLSDGTTSKVDSSKVYISPSSITPGTIGTVTFTVYYSNSTGAITDISDNNKTALTTTTTFTLVPVPQKIELINGTVNTGTSYSAALSTFGENAYIQCTKSDGNTEEVDKSLVYISPDSITETGVATTVTFAVYYNSDTGEIVAKDVVGAKALMCTTTFTLEGSEETT